MRLGGAEDRLKTRLDSLQKVFAQTGPPRLIPGVSFIKVGLRLGGDDQISGHGDRESVA